MPMSLKSKTQYDQTDTAEECGWVCDDKSGFWVEATSMSFSVISAYCIV